MSPVSYATMLEGKTKAAAFQLRLEIVRFARRQGIRETARSFRCSRNTVRRWKRRYDACGISGLAEKSRAPRRIPHKTSRRQERLVLECRRKIPCFGAERLKDAFALRPSIGAIGRILRQHRLTRRRRRKHERKRDLHAVKASYRSFSRPMVDTKYLSDIPRYWPQMSAAGLPGFQYTWRDPKTGAVFLGYAQQITVLNSSIFLRRILDHLRAHELELGGIVVQSDAGGEFGGPRHRRTDRGFPHAIEVAGARHTYIPPHYPDANADVESFHATIEWEFFDLESFGSTAELLAKATLFQHYYNFARPISTRGKRTPWDILHEDLPLAEPAILALPPVLLDDYLPRHYAQATEVGQHVPVVLVEP